MSARHLPWNENRSPIVFPYEGALEQRMCRISIVCPLLTHFANELDPFSVVITRLEVHFRCGYLHLTHIPPFPHIKQHQFKRKGVAIWRWKQLCQRAINCLRLKNINCARFAMQVTCIFTMIITKYACHARATGCHGNTMAFLPASRCNEENASPIASARPADWPIYGVTRGQPIRGHGDYEPKHRPSNTWR